MCGKEACCRVGVLDTPIPNRNQEGVQRLGELLHLIDHWTAMRSAPRLPLWLTALQFFATERVAGGQGSSTHCACPAMPFT